MWASVFASRPGRAQASLGLPAQREGPQPAGGAVEEILVTRQRPAVSYCQKVQYRQPPGSLPGPEVPWRATHRGWVEAKARLLPVQSFHHCEVV